MYRKANKEKENKTPNVKDFMNLEVSDDEEDQE